MSAPGDSTHGASAGQVINCRCTTVPIIYNFEETRGFSENERETQRVIDNILDKKSKNDIINKREELLQKGYQRAVDKGDISPLVGLDVYKDVANKMSNEIVGRIAPNGIKITGYKTHFIDRVIGQTSTPHKGMRQGISFEQIKNAISNGIVKESKSGNLSQLIIGKDISITINPITGNLIQANRIKVKK